MVEENLAMQCDCGTIFMRSMENQKFSYSNVVLEAKFPVYACPECGIVFYDGEGELAREQAVENYLKGK